MSAENMVVSSVRSQVVISSDFSVCQRSAGHKWGHECVYFFDSLRLE